MAYRDVTSLVRLGRQADPGQLGRDIVQIVGFRIDRDIALMLGLGDPAVKRLYRHYRLILGAVDGDLFFLRRLG